MGTTAVGDGAGALWSAHSPKIGLVEKQNSYCRTGEHRPEGMMIVRGSGIDPCRIQRVISILDLAPTFCRMLECDMPTASGKPIPELVGF
jgi:hypothetical protein